MSAVRLAFRTPYLARARFARYDLPKRVPMSAFR